MKEKPEDHIGTTADIVIGGVTYHGQIRRVLKISGAWYGFGYYFNAPYGDEFRVRLPLTLEG